MKPRSHKRTALFVLSLLIGLGLCCGLWIHKEQRQVALDKQLIQAIESFDNKEAIRLLDAGADPNTRTDSMPFPPLSQILAKLPTTQNPTAFMLECAYIRSSDLSLLKAMLRHGANVNAKGSANETALYYAVEFNEIDSVDHHDVVQFLLAHGADPDTTIRVKKGREQTEEPIELRVHSADISFIVKNGMTPLRLAEGKSPDLVILLRKYSKHP